MASMIPLFFLSLAISAAPAAAMQTDVVGSVALVQVRADLRSKSSRETKKHNRDQRDVRQKKEDSSCKSWCYVGEAGQTPWTTKCTMHAWPADCGGCSECDSDEKEKQSEKNFPRKLKQDEDEKEGVVEDAAVKAGKTNGNKQNKTKKTASAWKDLGGEDSSCRLDENDTSRDGDGSAKVHDGIEDMRTCKKLCEKMGSNCTGIEYREAGQRCETWTQPIEHTAYAPGYECQVFNAGEKEHEDELEEGDDDEVAEKKRLAAASRADCASFCDEPIMAEGGTFYLGWEYKCHVYAECSACPNCKQEPVFPEVITIKGGNDKDDVAGDYVHVNGSITEGSLPYYWKKDEHHAIVRHERDWRVVDFGETVFHEAIGHGQNFPPEGEWRSRDDGGNNVTVEVTEAQAPFLEYCGFATGANAKTLSPGAQCMYGDDCNTDDCKGLSDCMVKCNECEKCHGFRYQPSGLKGVRCRMKSSLTYGHIGFQEDYQYPNWGLYVNTRDRSCATSQPSSAYFGTFEEPEEEAEVIETTLLTTTTTMETTTLATTTVATTTMATTTVATTTLATTTLATTTMATTTLATTTMATTTLATTTAPPTTTEAEEVEEADA